MAAILAVAAACLVVAATGAYARYAVFDQARFADRAAALLNSDEVRDEVAARIGARVVADQPELATGEAAVEDAVASGIANDLAFHAAFRTSAAQLHRALFSDADAQASFVVAGSGEALRQQLEGRMPAMGPLPPIADPPLMTLGTNEREHALRELAPVADDLDVPLTIVLGVAGLALLGAGVARAGDRRRGVWAGCLTVAAVGGLLAAGVTAGRDIVLTHFDTSIGDAVVSQIWNGYLGDLRTWGLALCAAGLIVAAAAGGPRPAPRAVLAAPATNRGRVARAAGLLVLAWLAVEVPELVLHVTLVTLAAGLVYVAAGDLLRVLAPPRAAGRMVRLAAASAVALAVIAALAVSASGTEVLPARVAATGLPETTASASAHGGGRAFCLSREEARWLAAQGVSAPPHATLRSDGRLCSRP